MVVVARQMQQAVDHETRVFLDGRNARAPGLSNGHGDTDVYLTLDGFLVVGEVKRKHVRGPVFAAVLAVQFRDAFGADENDGNIALSSGLFRTPQILKTDADGRPVMLGKIVNARVQLAFVDIIDGKLKCERIFLR